jgi:hypothetical protein
MGTILETRKTGKLYYDIENQHYFEITSRKDNYDSKGNLISADISVDIFSSYTYDDDKNKYVGVDKIGTTSKTVYYGEKAKAYFLYLKNGGSI